MNKTEKLALVASILWLIVYIAIPVFVPLTIQYCDTYEGYSMSDHALLQAGMSLVGLLIPLAIGIWLFLNAPKQNLNKWVWLLFGCCFGANALILYFVYLIYTRITPEQNRALT